MPSVSKKQYKFFKAVENNTEFAEKVDVPQEVGKEMTKGNKGKKRFSKLIEKVGKKK
jgi:hypothetical protein